MECGRHDTGSKIRCGYASGFVVRGVGGRLNSASVLKCSSFIISGRGATILVSLDSFLVLAIGFCLQGSRGTREDEWVVVESSLAYIREVVWTNFLL